MIAAIFNIIIFGTGAAIYLYAVDLIMDTATLPGWLQVVLVWLVGVVGWLLLRPYRRITQTGRQGLDRGDHARPAAGTGGSSATRATPRGSTSSSPAARPSRGSADRRSGATPRVRTLRPESRTEELTYAAEPDRGSAAAAVPAGRPAPAPAGRRLDRTRRAGRAVELRDLPARLGSPNPAGRRPAAGRSRARSAASDACGSLRRSARVTASASVWSWSSSS